MPRSVRPSVLASRLRDAAAAILVLRHGRSRDRHVGARVEEVARRAAVASGPLEGNAEQSHGGTPTVLAEILREPERGLRRPERVLRLQRREIADEVHIPTALNFDEHADEVVVGVQAAGKYDG